LTRRASVSVLADLPNVAQVDCIPLSVRAVRPTQGKTLAVTEVPGPGPVPRAATNARGPSCRAGGLLLRLRNTAVSGGAALRSSQSS
jgi:hypothetical protein